MRRMIQVGVVFVLAVAVGSVVAVGLAAPKTVLVTISKNGFVPESVTIAQGDTVQFTNSDSVVHQITFKSMTGITCSGNPVVVATGASATCTFQTAGNYSYTDPNTRGNTFRGNVTVTAPAASLSASAKPVLVVYGNPAVLSGTLSTQQAGENVDVLAQPCGASSATKVTTVQTATGGAYGAAVKPLQNTAYTTKSKAVTSSVVTVRVRPRLRVTKVAAHRYSLRVTGATSFAGKYASFQRYNGTLRRWVAVRTVLLKANATGVAPTVVSAAVFRSPIRAGLRVRVTLAQAQVGSCYASGLSNTIFS
jgi:plastocyanin